MNLSLLDAPALRPPLDLTGTHRRLLGWVRHTASLTRPDRVVWCGATGGGSGQPVVRVSTPPVSPDVAEVRTLLATPRAAAGGGRHPDRVREEVLLAFEDAMRGRTMYVVPFAPLVGALEPAGDGAPAIGVQITDSPTVVTTLEQRSAAGGEVPVLPADGTDFVAAIHSIGYPLLTGRARRRPDGPRPAGALTVVAHIPETAETWSFGTAEPAPLVLGEQEAAR